MVAQQLSDVWGPIKVLLQSVSRRSPTLSLQRSLSSLPIPVKHMTCIPRILPQQLISCHMTAAAAHSESMQRVTVRCQAGLSCLCHLTSVCFPFVQQIKAWGGQKVRDFSRLPLISPATFLGSPHRRCRCLLTVPSTLISSPLAWAVLLYLRHSGIKLRDSKVFPGLSTEKEKWLAFLKTKKVSRRKGNLLRRSQFQF